MILKMLDRPDLAPKEIGRPENFVEIADQYQDASKLLGMGYRPKITFADGLAETLRWYKRHHPFLDQMGGELLD